MEEIKTVRALAPAWTMEESEKNRNKEIEFIDYCVSKRMTYNEIGDIMGCCKARVYQLLRYGSVAITTARKKEVKARDKNECRICMRSDKKLHVHHINNPKDHSADNLMTLCVSCHRRVEKLTNKVRSYPQVKDIGALRK